MAGQTRYLETKAPASSYLTLRPCPVQDSAALLVAASFEPRGTAGCGSVCGHPSSVGDKAFAAQAPLPAACHSARFDASSVRRSASAAALGSTSCGMGGGGASLRPCNSVHAR